MTPIASALVKKKQSSLEINHAQSLYLNTDKYIWNHELIQVNQFRVVARQLVKECAVFTKVVHGTHTRVAAFWVSVNISDAHVADGCWWCGVRQ